MDWEAAAIRRIKDLRVGEQAYTIKSAILLQRIGEKYNPMIYLENTVRFEMDRKAGFYIPIRRIGDGAGEFTTDFVGGIDSLVKLREPMFEIVDNYRDYCCDEGCFTELLVPFGYKGTEEDYIRDFFPDSVEHFAGDLMERSDISDAFEGIRGNGDLEKDELKSRFPRTWKQRLEYQEICRSGKNVQESTRKYIRIFNQKGEPLTQAEARDLLR